MLESVQPDRPSKIIRVFVVVVLYKMQPGESAAFRTLQAAVSNLQEEQADIGIMLYDNTPGGQDAGVLPSSVRYRADIKNSGLANAYNYALEIAYEEGFDWLLTLDQDTSLPADFVSELCHAAAFVEPLRTIGAIVPVVSGDGRVISPKIFMKRFALLKRFSFGYIGISSEETIAINSASAIRVSALKAIDGYDPRFYLHASDVVLFHRLHCHDFRVFVAGNINVEHEMSVFDLKSRSTPRGYEQNIRSEEAFYDEYLGMVGQIVLLLRICQRLVYRLWRTGGSLPYFMITIRSLCRRLFYSRKHRMKLWEQSVIRDRRNS